MNSILENEHYVDGDKTIILWWNKNERKHYVYVGDVLIPISKVNASKAAREGNLVQRSKV